jgi:hypothetical protein
MATGSGEDVTACIGGSDGQCIDTETGLDDSPTSLGDEMGDSAVCQDCMPVLNGAANFVKIAAVATAVAWTGGLAIAVGGPPTAAAIGSGVLSASNIAANAGMAAMVALAYNFEEIQDFLSGLGTPSYTPGAWGTFGALVAITVATAYEVYEYYENKGN